MGHVNDASTDCGIKKDDLVDYIVPLFENFEGFNPIKCAGDVKHLIDDVNTIIAHV